jgi:hypothetical protein
MPSSSAAWALKYWPRVSAVPLGGREDVRLWQAGNLAFVLVALPFVRVRRGGRDRSATWPVGVGLRQGDGLRYVTPTTA